MLYLEELNLAQSQAQTTLYLIGQYKALGGAGQLEVKPVDEPLRPWGRVPGHRNVRGYGS